MNPYFNQSLEWSNFFVKANNNQHEIITIVHEGFKILVYQYPFIGKSKFWYVPRFLIFKEGYSSEQYIDITNQILAIINLQAKQNKISYITFDFDKRLLDNCNYNSATQFNVPLKTGSKKLQYLTTPILDVTNLEGESSLTVLEFFKANEKGFFGKVNKTCRNLTRRALEKNWQYEVTKDLTSFDKFWELWNLTAQKHGFNLHPKQYIIDLLSYDWAELIVIKDMHGVIQSGGIIVTIGDSSIHLYGANSDEALEKGSQYFFHVLALKLIKAKQKQGKIIKTYDLGGSDDAGYGNFKKSYKPEYLYFDGPYDIVLNPIKVGLYNGIRKVKKIILKN
jgi:lipid II:glycine glycyltransferase (peptidoglycan interpeptide bridge formation enzyme)